MYDEETLFIFSILLYNILKLLCEEKYNLYHDTKNIYDKNVLTKILNFIFLF